MVVVSHEGILKDSKFSQFLRNAVEWLKPSPEALVGVHPRLDSLCQSLLGGDVKVQAGAELSPSLGVYCMDAYDSTRAKDLVGFVKRGGGLLVGGQAWHWASRHGKEKVLFEFPGDQVTSVAGVYFTGSEGETGTFSVSKEMLRIPLITQPSWWEDVGRGDAAQLALTIGSCIHEKCTCSPEVTGLHD
ncbi:TRPM8 channel-associated factor 2 [Opisthocomus hoazin]|uniref:TRPM8 channel-associated factor 2 n=1 Tax=Opisthocomus hoazin TaxID=30419 RepID=UPI003F5359B0